MNNLGIWIGGSVDVILIALIWLFFANPIKRHRRLYGKAGLWMAFFSIMLIATVIITIYMCSCISRVGAEELLSDKTQTGSLWRSIIAQFADPGNIPLAEEGKGTLIAIICAFAGILCISGLIVSSLVSFISHKSNAWKKGLIYYGKKITFKNYVVVIGINEQTASIVRRSLKRNNVDYVLIQTRQDVERTRLELESKIDDSEEGKIVYYAGDRTSYEDVCKLHLEKAKEVYILGESIDNADEKDHDSYNVSCLEHISNYMKENMKENRKCVEKRLRVHVEFDYQSTFTAFKATHLYLKLSRRIEFIPFNIHEIWAKKVLVDNFAIYPAGNIAEMKVQRYFPLDKTGGGTNYKYSGISYKCDTTVHLIVVGMNQMGMALATQAALLCHFPNFARDKKNKTTITFIDDNAKREAEYYIGRYSTLFELSQYIIKLDSGTQLDEVYKHTPDFKSKENKDSLHHLVDDDEEELMDVDWEFIEGNVASKPIQDYIKTIATEHTNELLTIAICFNDSQQSLASAMYLPKVVYDKCNQVLVYQRSIFDLVNDVSNGDSYWRRYNKKLYPFGMNENAYIENPFDNFIAKLDYFVCQNPGNVKLLSDCRANPSDKATWELLDKVDKVWEQVGIVRKIASVDSAESIQTRLRSLDAVSRKRLVAIGTEDKENNPLADEDCKKCIIESEHMRWMMQRLIAGYRYYLVDEQTDLLKEEVEKRKRYVDEKKDEERAHVDIRSFRKQHKIDINHETDEEQIINVTSHLIFGSELLSVLRLCNSRYKESQHYHWLKKFFLNEGKYNSFVFVKGAECPDKKQCSHSFWMSEAAVTVEQWYEVMGMAVPKKEKHEKKLPKVNVSKEQIDDFLDILKKRSGLNFELPSFKEWYTAAKGYEGDEKRVIGAKKRKPARIGRTLNDAKKLHHILGNVWEWTHSEDNHGGFVFCGGSFRFKEKECELKNQYEYFKKSWDEKSKSEDLGFRLIWPFDKDIPWIKNGADGNAKKNRGGKPDVDKIVKWFETYKMVLIEPGYFIMGSDKTIDPNTPIEEVPRHSVKISKEYYICSVPVTQSLWNAVYGYDDMRKNPTENQYGDEFPQTNVRWSDVNDFIKKLNTLLMKETYLKNFFKDKAKGLEFRLPTEAEWEYAAKGGSDARIVDGDFKDVDAEKPLKYSSEDEAVKNNDDREIYKKKVIKYPIYAGSDNAKDVAWYGQLSIHEVAQKQPYKGLFDMSGNVWEWCYDFYIAEMYPACKIGDGKYRIQEKVVVGQYINNGYIIDPVALEGSKFSAHVLRGGSWRCPTEYDCRCTRANFWVENHKSNDIGFRLVLGKPINEH